MHPIPQSLAVGFGMAALSYAAYASATWLRYGHPRKARGDAADASFDRFMREYDVCDRHAVAVAAPAEVTLDAAKRMDLNSSPLIRTIFKGRELILSSSPAPATSRKGLIEDMKSIGWGVLDDQPGREVIMGAVTKPWQANPVFRPLPPEQFASFAEPDYVKIAWTLRATPRSDGGSIFQTETRAMATDAAARKKFRTYWAFLSPGIVLIRFAMLPLLKAAAERNWRIEGDDVLSDARAQLTHSTTIFAPPKDVWPWLLQMGCQRAGWYSWDRLDNGGVPSANRIIPELQHLKVGDVLPARPVGSEGFEVLRIVPERALVLSGLSPQWAGTWSFVLEPVGSSKTRLVTRYRAAYPPNVRMTILLPVLATLHAFMERKQLSTIKHHAEHMHAA